MTLDETRLVLAMVIENYSQFYKNKPPESAKANLKLWHELLADIPFDKVKLAIEVIIMTSEYPPTIATVRRKVLESTQAKISTSGEAWGEVQQAIRNFGYMNGEKALESMKPLTREVVKNMGWFTLCTSEDLMADRAHFLKMYETLENRKTEELKIPSSFREEIRRRIEASNPVQEKPQITEKKAIGESIPMPSDIKSIILKTLGEDSKVTNTTT